MVVSQYIFTKWLKWWILGGTDSKDEFGDAHYSVDHILVRRLRVE